VTVDDRLTSASGATRFLCAAAYRDRAFADWVVDEVLENELRAAAPSYGVDIVPVIRHCVRARALRIIRNALLTLVLLGGGVLLTALGATTVDVLLRLVPLAWAIVFASLCLVHYEIVTAGMMRGRFDPTAAPRVSARRERLLEVLAREARSNVTVYSGFSPFVGCGVEIGGWSFVVDMRRGAEDLAGDRREPIAFEVDDLYRCAIERMNDLHLDRLTMEGRLFVSGRDLLELPWLLARPASRPHTWVDPHAVDHFRQHPSSRVRHYLAIRVVDWQGELVLSMFLRFSFTGDNLFCEASRFLLLPFTKRHHEVDDLNGAADLRFVGGLLARSVLLTIPLVVIAPFALLVRAVGPLNRWWERRTYRRLARHSPTFDYGAATTVRERAMSKDYRHYFQKLDREMYVKLVEQQILDAVITFLDSKRIDTRDLRQRQTTIQNSGVIVSGGTLQAQSFAVGASAVATVRTAMQSVPRPAGKA
jgi:hypothetical protein